MLAIISCIHLTYVDDVSLHLKKKGTDRAGREKGRERGKEGDSGYCFRNLQMSKSKMPKSFTHCAQYLHIAHVHTEYT